MLDNGYWNAFYKRGQGLDAPSKFAQYCQDHVIEKGSSKIFEAGCGNGRDARFFGSLGHDVTALDQSDEVIRSNLSHQQQTTYPISYKAGDFVAYLNAYQDHYDVIYSRFTMHAISSAQQAHFLEACLSALKPAGKLCIEVRTINDELYGVGKALGDNAFYSDHYRRFIDPNQFAGYLDNSHWNIVSFKEAKGFAPYANEDPLILRVVLEK